VFTPHRLAASLDLLLAAVPRASDQPAPGLCVALSGGLDSSVLLVALAQLANAGSLAARLRAIHVDHALHADSAQWARACRELADSHGVA
jgi:tRNA(Ile)-lysidine synthase